LTEQFPRPTVAERDRPMLRDDFVKVLLEWFAAEAPPMARIEAEGLANALLECLNQHGICR
jgi:hypothetical protein